MAGVAVKENLGVITSKGIPVKSCFNISNVLDEVCERDFYFGIAQSGISVIGDDNSIYKAPYFKPFGNPIERASIPREYESEFSNGCLRRNMELWNEINKLSGRDFLIKDLPEKIINTNDSDEIVKVLKKGVR